MTVETLHDALTLLPADLVAAADKRRSRKPKVIYWQRWAAMAACLAMILGCGFLFRSGLLGGAEKSMAVTADSEAAAAEAPMAAAPAMLEETPAEAENGAAAERQEISAAAGTNGVQEFAAQDTATLAPGFLEADWVETPYGGAVNCGSTPHITLVTNIEDLEYYLTRRDFQDMSALQEFAAFQEADWLDIYDLLLVRLPWTEPTLLDIQETEAGWNIVLPQKNPEQSGSYHLLLTVEKGLIPSADAVTVVFE